MTFCHKQLISCSIPYIYICHVLNISGICTANMAQTALQAVVGSCIACHSTVHTRQEALKCNVSGFWQHRTCGTGIFRDTYRMPWVCDGC